MSERIMLGLGIVGTGTGLAGLLWLVAQLLK
jgi:hypothetical protein